MNNEIKEFDKKWYLVENRKDIRRITKLFNLEKTKYPVLLYTFIDPNEGVSALILGNIKVKDNVGYLNDEMFNDSLFIIRYDELVELGLNEVDKSIIKKIKHTDEVEHIIQTDYYKGYEKLLLTREDSKLDKFRQLGDVDNITVQLMNRNKTKEERICKLKEKVKDDEYIVCLLEDTKIDFGVSKDELIRVKYIDIPELNKVVYLNRPKNNEEN